MEKWNNLKIRQFDNLTIRQWEECLIGKMENWNDERFIVKLPTSFWRLPTADCQMPPYAFFKLY
jgi:hypothetical protein